MEKTMSTELVIPPRPEILMEIQALIKSENLELSILSNLIKKDVSLFSILMSAVNSPWLGLSQRVDNVETAVSLLGQLKIVNLLQAVIVRSCFKSSPLKISFWETATEVASISDNISEQYGIENAEDAFTTGMLHNIGIAVMQSNFSQFNSFMDTSSHHAIDRLCVMQRQTFNTDHFLQGALLAQSWYMPTRVTQAIRYQPIAQSILTGHKDIGPEPSKLLAVLTLAKNISNNYRHYWNIQEDKFQLKSMNIALDYLNINKNEFKEYQEDIVENLVAENKTT
ncbi:MAG: HD-like signal output (HDOD) protein [Bermanella sp.]|jgi:HD-like signal output (HDOD) protein